MKKENVTVICFGEVLWDVLPDKRIPGGAPMNVAYHLHKLGLNAQVVSCVGSDEAGAALIQFLEEIGLSTQHIQVRTDQPTSEVLARIDANNEVTYEIVYPVAWDKIQYNPELGRITSSADAFVFGSLSSRDAESRDTLLNMLEHARYRVFDVNLRAPHYTVDTLTKLLKRTDLVKMNASELLHIAGLYSSACKTESECVDLLYSEFDIQEVLITKGSTGATYHSPMYRYDYPAYKTNVADTIGSGDSFLAAFLSMKLLEEPMELVLDHAVAMGAFITSQNGGCPPYSKAELNHFIWKKKLASSNPFQEG
jgi:fructokinase